MPGLSFPAFAPVRPEIGYVGNIGNRSGGSRERRDRREIGNGAISGQIHEHELIRSTAPPFGLELGSEPELPDLELGQTSPSESPGLDLEVSPFGPGSFPEIKRRSNEH